MRHSPGRKQRRRMARLGRMKLPQQRNAKPKKRSWWQRIFRKDK